LKVEICVTTLSELPFHQAVSGPLPRLYRLFGVFTRVATALTNQPPYC